MSGQQIVASTRTSTAENPLPCPVPSPTGTPCTKTIPPGWTADEGHAGGHFWADKQTVEILAGGHYDATAALSGEPFVGHVPVDCPGSACPHSGGVHV